MKKQYFFLLLGLLCLLSCRKEPDPDDHSSIPLVFTSLSCGRDTIFTEDTTSLEAKASGYELIYNWSVEKGDLLGSGNTITFVATPCTIGDNSIYCTITDGNGNEETKFVVITVL